jgi:hypothetical protein
MIAGRLSVHPLAVGLVRERHEGQPIRSRYSLPLHHPNTSSDATGVTN